MSPQPDKATLFLIPADIKKLHGLNLQKNCESGGSWLYLGKNILLRASISKILGDRWNRIPLGTDLQRTAIALRQDYIDYIGILGSKNSGLNWWLTSVSEKSPFISDVFLQFCYSQICVGYAKSRPEVLLVICESPALLDSLAINLQGIRPLDLRDGTSEFVATSVAKIRNSFETFFQLGWFAIRYCARIIVSRLFARMRLDLRIQIQDRQIVVIHSWTDKRSFNNPSAYENVYFGKLADRIEERGIPAVHLVNVLPTMHYLAGLRELLKRSGKVVLIEEFMRISDILKALQFVKTPSIPREEIPVFLGLDVREIVIAELTKDRLDSRAQQSALYYCAMQRMGKAWNILTFTYAFENQILEKMFCMGLRRSNPKIKIIAYTSTFAIPMYTFYAVSKHEMGIIPLPDRVVVNSSRSREVLKKSGFDQTDIVIAGDIRYNTSSSEKSDSIRPPHGSKPVIFVPLSASVLDSLELIDKVGKAFGRDCGLQVIFKSHPVLPFTSLKEHLPTLPDHITFVDKSVGELLAMADLVIYTETTVSIEALARGIPVLHIMSDQRIDMNPLEGYSCIPSVTDPEELRTTAYGLLEQASKFREIYKEIAAGFFDEIHPGVVDIFIR
jgi:surface carbohydrate biosynthesis protein (TIGR04326 family)